MVYTPDMRRYQQLDEPITGRFDCTAYSAAILLDAHTQGVTKTAGRTVRLRSDEKIPDPKSPGLNLPQVDRSILLIAPRVDLDTRIGYQSLTRDQIRNRAVDGRWFTAQFYRGVLVDRGFVDDYRGPHAATVHTLPGDPGTPILGDPLIDHYVRIGWDSLFDAMELCPGTGGKLYSQFTRDLTPDYRAVIKPDPGYDLRKFARFIVKNGVIVDTRESTTEGIDLDCTAPAYFPSRSGKKGRMLVMLTEGKYRKGWYVDDRWAREKNP